MQQDPAPQYGKNRIAQSTALPGGLLVVSLPRVTFSYPAQEDSGPIQQGARMGDIYAQTMVRQCFSWLTHVEDSGPVVLWLCWHEQKTPAPLAQPLVLALQGLQNLWRIGPIRFQCEPFVPGQMLEAEKLLRDMPQQGESVAEPPDKNTLKTPLLSPSGTEQVLRPQTGRVPTILLLNFTADEESRLHCQPLLLRLPALTPPCCDTLMCRKSPPRHVPEQAEPAQTIQATQTIQPAQPAQAAQAACPQPAVNPMAMPAPGAPAAPAASGASAASCTPATSDAYAAPGEIFLDGVRYTELPQDGQFWRIGAVNPLWRQELLVLPHNPDAAALAALEPRGLWLAPAHTPPPLAVMCCGLGAVWPGMGRELYDSFPAARAVMDRIAAVADWNVLGLMDEKDVEKVSLTRWQSPYLFMLELAQWSVLSSLGLRPSLFCGHSLGEIIALYFSGICSLEVAWYILDTRAVHMAELEAAATRETGMMAVHANAEIVEEICATWPSLYVSNYNTPQQFILSGPREALQEARKSMRKRRIPAIVLNLSLAFHHPSMRLLRDLSLRRLNAMEMHAPSSPMLSCTTTDFYPNDQPSICQHITDLDENAVRWTECVHAMWNRDGIRHFVELGPQDTLCSLTRDNESRALCLSAGRKGKEVEAMRQACARLYALGHLREDSIRARVAYMREGQNAAAVARTPLPHCGLVPAGTPDAACPADHSAQVAPPAQAPAQTPAQAPAQPLEEQTAAQAPAQPLEEQTAAPSNTAHTPAAAPSSAEALHVVMDVLARASGRAVEGLRPEMDLRYHLALRSSRFPLIIQEVEKALDITVNFEDLLKVSTIGDLTRILGGNPLADDQQEHTTAGASLSRRVAQACAPLCRFAPLLRPQPEKNVLADENPLAKAHTSLAKSALAQLPLDPCGQGLPVRKGDVLALLFFEPDLLPSLMSGLAPLACVLAVPKEQLEACAPLAKAGSRLVPLDLRIRTPQSATEALALAEESRMALDALARREGRVDGLIFTPAAPAQANGTAYGPASSDADFAATRMPEVLKAAMRSALNHGLRHACLCSLLLPAQENMYCDGPLEKCLEALGQEAGVAVRTVRLLESNLRAGLNEWGDLLARELLRGTAEHVFWARYNTLPTMNEPGHGADHPNANAGPSPTSAGLALIERPRVYPLVFPDPHPPYRGTATLFQGGCHYSRFADANLALHGGQPGNALAEHTPWLPPGRALAALLEASSLWLPWLTVTGFSDLRFHEPPLLPPGITRECRLTVEAEPWLMQDGVMTRMCRGELAVREISPNGRHLGQYAPVAGGMTLLAADNGQVPPLWPHETHILDKNDGSAVPGLATELFYEALGLGAPWRMLQDFLILPEHRYAARLNPPHAAIAPGDNKGYADVLHVVEGMVQAAWLSIAQEAEDTNAGITAVARAVRCWRLHAAGFIRFGAERGKGPWHVVLRRSWSDSRLLRFDGQAVDERGRIFLTLHHLEFDRRDHEPTAL